MQGANVYNLQRNIMVKTKPLYGASRGFSATAELLVVFYYFICTQHCYRCALLVKVNVSKFMPLNYTTV